MENGYFLNSVSGLVGESHESMEVRLLSHTTRQKLIQSVSKTKYKRLTVIDLEEKMGESVNLHDNGFGYGFIYITPKVQEKRKKRGKMNVNKI